MTAGQAEFFNEMGHNLRLGMSIEQAMWELANSRQRLLDAISSATERGLDGSLYGEANLLSKHEAEHTGWIARWRRDMGA